MRRSLLTCAFVIALTVFCQGILAVPVASAKAPAAAAPSTAIPGWPGQTAQYLGRYRVVSSSDASLAQQGELTLFMRKVNGQPKPVLSGILSLHGASGSNVLYLTHFVHSGMKLSTTLSAGIYTGPVVGRFVVTTRASGRLTVALVVPGGAPVALRLVRFSANPHP